MQDISKSILARAFIFGLLIGVEKKITWLTFEDFTSSLTELRNCEILTPILSVHLLSLLVLKFTVCAQVYSVCLHDFHKNNNEINESYKLCQVRGKHTVGGIVFYKHLFLVFTTFMANNVSFTLLERWIVSV